MLGVEATGHLEPLCLSTPPPRKPPIAVLLLVVELFHPKVEGGMLIPWLRLEPPLTRDGGVQIPSQLRWINARRPQVVPPTPSLGAWNARIVAKSSDDGFCHELRALFQVSRIHENKNKIIKVFTAAKVFERKIFFFFSQPDFSPKKHSSKTKFLRSLFLVRKIDSQNL